MRRPIQRTPKEIMEAVERTEQIRAEIQRANVSVTQVAYNANISTQTFYHWLRVGLTAERFMRLLSAVGAARDAAGKV